MTFIFPLVQIISFDLFKWTGSSKPEEWIPLGWEKRGLGSTARDVFKNWRKKTSLFARSFAHKFVCVSVQEQKRREEPAELPPPLTPRVPSLYNTGIRLSEISSAGSLGRLQRSKCPPPPLRVPSTPPLPPLNLLCFTYNHNHTHTHARTHTDTHASDWCEGNTIHYTFPIWTLVFCHISLHPDLYSFLRSFVLLVCSFCVLNVKKC